MTLYPKLIMDALAKVRYPGTGKDLVTMGMVEDNIRIDGNKVSFSLLFEKPNDPFIKSVVKAAETAILTYVRQGWRRQKYSSGQLGGSAGFAGSQGRFTGCRYLRSFAA